MERERIEARYAHFALWTDDAAATAAEDRALGLPAATRSGPTGLRQVFVKHPDGNMVEFIGPTKLPSSLSRRMDEAPARVPVSARSREAGDRERAEVRLGRLAEHRAATTLPP